MTAITAELLAAADVHPVRAARALRGLTQRELEKKAGLAKTTVSHIEQGTRQADPATKTRISMALEVDVAALFPAPAVTRPEPPRRRRRTSEEEKSHALAYSSIERWVRQSGRSLSNIESTLPLELRCRPGGDELDEVDVQELVAFARRLGSGPKDADYMARERDAARWLRDGGWKKDEQQLRAEFNEQGLEDEDISHLLGIARIYRQHGRPV